MAGPERILLAVRNAAAALLVTLVGVYLARLLFPFLLGVIIAVVLDPVVSAASGRGWPRGLVAVALLLVLTGGTAGLLVVGVARLGAEVASLVESGWGEELLGRLGVSWSGLEELLRGEPARRGLGALAGWTLSVFRAVPGAAVATAISLLSAYLMLRDKQRLLAGAGRLLPQRLREEGARAGRELARGFGGVIRAQFLLSLTTGILAIAGLSAVRVRYAWLLGLGAGALDLVPMVGPMGVFLPTAAYLALTGDPGKAVGVLVVAGVALVVRQLLEPRFLSAGTGLHPLAMLVAVYAGYRLFGPFGLVMGPIAAAFFCALFRAAVEPFLD